MHHALPSSSAWASLLRSSLLPACFGGHIKAEHGQLNGVLLEAVKARESQWWAGTRRPRADA